MESSWGLEMAQSQPGQRRPGFGAGRSRKRPEQLVHPSELELGTTGMSTEHSDAATGRGSGSGFSGGARAGATSDSEYRLRVLLLVVCCAVLLLLGVVLAGSVLQALVLALVVAAVGAAGVWVLWAQRYPARARAALRRLARRLSGQG